MTDNNNTRRGTGAVQLRRKHDKAALEAKGYNYEALCAKVKVVQCL